MKSSFTISETALEASYHIAKLIARQKKTTQYRKTSCNQPAWKLFDSCLKQRRLKRSRKCFFSKDTINTLRAGLIQAVRKKQLFRTWLCG